MDKRKETYFDLLMMFAIAAFLAYIIKSYYL